MQTGNGLDNLEKELTCPVYKHIFRKPVRLDCKDSKGEFGQHLVEQAAADKILASNKKCCPMCKQPINRYDRDRNIENIVDAFLKMRYEKPEDREKAKVPESEYQSPTESKAAAPANANPLAEPLIPQQQQFASPIGLRRRCKHASGNEGLGAIPLSNIATSRDASLATAITGNLATIFYIWGIESVSTQRDNAEVLKELQQDTGFDIDADLMEKSSWYKYLFCCLVCTGGGAGLGSLAGDIAAGMFSGMTLWGTGTTLINRSKANNQIAAEATILESLPRNAV